MSNGRLPSPALGQLKPVIFVGFVQPVSQRSLGFPFFVSNFIFPRERSQQLVHRPHEYWFEGEILKENSEFLTSFDLKKDADWQRCCGN